MLTFDEFLLKESRLVRLMQHLDNKDPIAFISSDRHDLSDKKNKENYNKLKGDTKLAGFGYNRIIGGYIEDGGHEVPDESSLIVYGSKDKEKRLLSFAMAMGKKYNQDSILFVDTNGDAFWINTTNNPETGRVFGARTKLGDFSISNIKKYYSEIKGKKFTFKTLKEQDISPTFETHNGK